MGSGKDTAAAYLRDIYGFERIAFADSVREEVFDYLKNDCRLEYPSSVLPLARNVSANEVYAKPTSAGMRRLLQYWGTELRRAQDPAYWLKALAAKVLATRPYVVSDVRFPNEVALIRALGGAVWLIDGRTSGEVGIAEHASERLELPTPDRVISNAGRLEDLYYYLDEAINGIAQAA